MTYHQLMEKTKADTARIRAIREEFERDCASKNPSLYRLTTQEFLEKEEES